MADAPAARNARCPCGSGQRYKACCGRVDAGGALAAPGLDRTMDRAIDAQRNGRYDEALALYAQALARSPGLPDALHMLGAIHWSIGDHRSALVHLHDAARRFDGGFPAATGNLAVIVASHLARIAPVESEALWLRELEQREARARAATACVGRAAVASGAARAGRVSIVVPSHNHAAFVEEALASALDQSRPADEIVVIDDGSTDGSVARIAAVARRSEGRIRFVARECRGAAATINEAVGMSTGDWIAILNSDDRFAPRRIEAMSAGVAGAGADWGYSRVECIDAQGGVVARGTHPHVDGLRDQQDGVASADTVGMAFVAANPAISTGTLFLSRALFEQVGGFRDLGFVHDWDFCLRACMVDEPVFVPEPLYAYRTHGANTIAAGANANAEGDDLLRGFYRDAQVRAGVPNPFAPLPSIWGHLFWLRAIEGGHAALLPPGIVERIAGELLEGLAA